MITTTISIVCSKLCQHSVTVMIASVANYILHVNSSRNTWQNQHSPSSDAVGPEVTGQENCLGLEELNVHCQSKLGK